MRVARDLLAVLVCRFNEANGTDVGLVRRPIRPNVDTMLGGFLQIEEHPTAEDAENGRTTQKGENVNKYAWVMLCKGIVKYAEPRA